MDRVFVPTATSPFPGLCVRASRAPCSTHGDEPAFYVLQAPQGRGSARFRLAALAAGVLWAVGAAALPLAQQPFQPSARGNSARAPRGATMPASSVIGNVRARDFIAGARCGRSLAASSRGHWAVPRVFRVGPRVFESCVCVAPDAGVRPWRSRMAVVVCGEWHPGGGRWPRLPHRRGLAARGRHLPVPAALPDTGESKTSALSKLRPSAPQPLPPSFQAMAARPPRWARACLQGLSRVSEECWCGALWGTFVVFPYYGS